MIKLIENADDKITITSNILRQLKDYFGIESALRNYIDQSPSLPMFAYEHDNEYVAFLSLKHHHTNHVEIAVMGVLKNFHRRGIGTSLIKEAKKYCENHAIKYLSVKTLDHQHPDQNYEKTRQFYKAMGFEAFETLPTLWDESNPCLLNIMTIGK